MRIESAFLVALGNSAQLFLHKSFMYRTGLLIGRSDNVAELVSVGASGGRSVLCTAKSREEERTEFFPVVMVIYSLSHV